MSSSSQISKVMLNCCELLDDYNVHENFNNIKSSKKSRQIITSRLIFANPIITLL